MDASLSLKTTKWTKFAWNKVRMGELGVSSLKCSRRSCVGLNPVFTHRLQSQYISEKRHLPHLCPGALRQRQSLNEKSKFVVEFVWCPNRGAKSFSSLSIFFVEIETLSRLRVSEL